MRRMPTPIDFADIAFSRTAFLFQGGEQADRLALTLVVALAGHELRDSVEVDNVPLLTQQAGGGVLLHVREVKSSGKGKGRRSCTTGPALAAVVAAGRVADCGFHEPGAQASVP